MHNVIRAAAEAAFMIELLIILKYCSFSFMLCYLKVKVLRPLLSSFAEVKKVSSSTPGR